MVSHGALAAGGVVSLAFGGLLLFDTDSEAFEISVPLVLLTAAILGGFFAWIIAKAVQARNAQVHTGTEELIGAHGEVRSPLAPLGHVFVKGALVASAVRARRDPGRRRGRGREASTA